jgi:hypothetical protein
MVREAAVWQNRVDMACAYGLAGVGSFLGTLISTAVFALVPSRTFNQQTQKYESNWGARIGISIAVFAVATLLFGWIGYSKGYSIGFCSANPKECAMFEAADMAAGAFGRFFCVQQLWQFRYPKFTGPRYLHIDR